MKEKGREKQKVAAAAAKQSKSKTENTFSFRLLSSVLCHSKYYCFIHFCFAIVEINKRKGKHSSSNNNNYYNCE